jgi:hypothetical protein
MSDARHVTAEPRGIGCPVIGRFSASSRKAFGITFINTQRTADPLRQTSADNHSEECDMSVPQKEKEGPASTMLRAVFAGFGSLLSVMDRVRGKSAAEAPTDAESPAPTAAAPEAKAGQETVAPETAVAETAAPETVAPETAVAETAAPETVAPETAVAETAAPETVAPETAVAETAAPETVAELPLANYDESTVASLRARLRNLSAGQLTQLIGYEKGHAARPDVISMFERRIAKIESEG